MLRIIFRALVYCLKLIAWYFLCVLVFIIIFIAFAVKFISSFILIIRVIWSLSSYWMYLTIKSYLRSIYKSIVSLYTNLSMFVDFIFDILNAIVNIILNTAEAMHNLLVIILRKFITFLIMISKAIAHYYQHTIDWEDVPNTEINWKTCFLTLFVPFYSFKQIFFAKNKKKKIEIETEDDINKKE